MIKIAHISDTHVKLLKDHDIYLNIFDKILKILKEEKPDIIVHTGDLFHNKTNLTPEAIKVAGDFLNNLANISPTYIIAGNHDMNLKNESRLDSISPVVDFLNNQNIFYFKKAEEKNIANNICLSGLVINDSENWKKPSNSNNINIALYHGAIAGVSTDIGYTMEHSDHDLSVFEGFDYALLGDIHLANQIVDTEGKCRYAGSTIQQNHGETDDKGFLIWEIEDKNTFNVRHISIPNPKPFFTVHLDEDGEFVEQTVPINARLRLVAETNLPLQTIRKAVDVAKVKFSPDSVTFVNKATERIDISEHVQEVDNEDLRDINIQQNLIREYLKDFKLDETMLDKVYVLNKKYNQVIEESEEVTRNVKWSLKRLEWNNLFNYGTGNSINFDKLEGVVGIFGKNFSGKSSIIDSLLWTMQNSVSKNVRKNVNIINQNRKDASAKAELVVGNSLYTIERTAEKYTKKLAGEETLEAKTDVWFSKCDISDPGECVEGDRGNLNGLDRNETDKNIRRVFGTLEDFLFTSMASQLGSLDFINEGSTRRKEILAKFLDLDIFAKKHKLANNDTVELKAALKRLEGRDFEKEINEILARSAEAKQLAENQSAECELLKKDISDLADSIKSVEVEIASMPKIDVIDIDATKQSLEKIDNDILSLQKLIAENAEFVAEKQKALENANNIIASIEIEELNKKKSIVTEKNNELNKLLRELNDVEKDISRDQKAIKILDEVPCGDKFPTCKFLIDAFQKKDELGEKTELVKILNHKKTDIQSAITELAPDEIEKTIATRNTVLEKIRNIENVISNKKLQSEQSNGKIITSQGLIEKLENKIENYYKNEETAIKLRELTTKKNTLTSEKTGLSNKLSECEANVLKLYKECGSLEQKCTTLEELKAELAKVRGEYAAVAMFERAMHSNGISYDIIRKKLPVINEEIAKVLSNIVEFEIYFEDDGKKLDILIKHPKYEARPIELCSGAEKNLAATAIRLALIKVSSLPQSDLFILDEPATSLDEENMEGFIRIIDMLKTQFKTIILISHLDALKDVADIQIMIDKVDGYAHVEV